MGDEDVVWNNFLKKFGERGWKLIGGHHGTCGSIFFFLEEKEYIIYKYLWEEADTKYNKVGR